MKDMKTMSNEDIKNVGLEILVDVHTFCIKHNIRYSLAYGTLIGAIRHKGFIPWDDDIDIIMPREDYERFFKSYKSERYKVASPSLNNSYLFFGRVYDTRTYVKAWRPQTTLDGIGVWIDVFPVDYVPEPLDDFSNEMNALNLLYKKSHEKREAMISLREIGYRHIKSISKMFFKRIATSHVNLLDVVRKADCTAKAVSKSDFMGCVTCHVYSQKERITSDVFSDYIDVEFEGYIFKSVRNYDLLLRNYYNDYMQLPPIEKRVYPHSAHKFFWIS